MMQRLIHAVLVRWGGGGPADQRHTQRAPPCKSVFSRRFAQWYLHTVCPLLVVVNTANYILSALPASLSQLSKSQPSQHIITVHQAMCRVFSFLKNKKTSFLFHSFSLFLGSLSNYFKTASCVVWLQKYFKNRFRASELSQATRYVDLNVSGMWCHDQQLGHCDDEGLLSKKKKNVKLEANFLNQFSSNHFIIQGGEKNSYVQLNHLAISDWTRPSGLLRVTRIEDIVRYTVP